MLELCLAGQGTAGQSQRPRIGMEFCCVGFVEPMCEIITALCSRKRNIARIEGHTDGRGFDLIRAPGLGRCMVEAQECGRADDGQSEDDDRT